MRNPGSVIALLALVVCAGCGAAPVSAVVSQNGLTARETATLRAGLKVARPLEFERNGARYVGGIAYQIVDAPAEDVRNAMTDPDLLREMLPRTKRVREVAASEEELRLELVQGNDFLQAEYTIIVDSSDQEEVRFRLDHKRPRDINDVWGYFRVKPLDSQRSLITVAVALDLGPGVVRLLFEKRIQELILSTPQRMKQALEERHHRGNGVLVTASNAN